MKKWRLHFKCVDFFSFGCSRESHLFFHLANNNSFALLFSVSSPDHIFLPIANWQPKEHPETEDDIGPLVQHIYEVWNYC